MEPPATANFAKRYFLFLANLEICEYSLDNFFMSETFNLCGFIFRIKSSTSWTCLKPKDLATVLL